MTKRVTRPPRGRRRGFPELMDRVADGLFLADVTGRFIDVNQAACKSLRYTRKELLSLSVADVAEEAASKLAEVLNGVAQAEPVIVDVTHVRKDGTTFPVQVNISAVEFDGERCLLAIARDMSTIVHAKEELRESEERLRAIFEAGFEGLVIHNAGDGMILDANPAFERMFGYTLSELAGKSVLDLVAPESRDLVMARLRAPLLGESLEAVGLRKDGTRLSIEILGGEHVYEGRAVRAAAVRDITERKRAEEALRESEKRWRLIAENSAERILLLDPDGTVQYINRTPTLPVEEITGTSIYSYMPPETAESLRRCCEGVLASGEAGTYEARHENDSGVHYFEGRVSPIVEDGSIVSLVVAAMEVTERKRAEEALRESEQRWRLIAENSAEIVILMDPDGTVQYINWTLTVPVEEVIGTSVYSHMSPAAAENLRRCCEGVLASGEPGKYETRHENDAGGRYFAGRVSPIVEDGSIVSFVVAVVEVTERKRAERALRESEEKFRLLAENAADIICRYRLSPNPGCEYISPAVTATTGYAPHEFYADPDLALKIIHPDDLGVLRQLIDQDLPGSHALRLLHKDGSIVWIELTYVPIYSDDGTRVALEGAARDITDRKRAEEALRESEERYRSLYIKAPAALHSIDREFRLIEVSDHWLELLGYERKEVIGRRSVEFLTEDSRRSAEATKLPDFWKTGRARNISYEFRRKNGEIVDVLLDAIVIRNEEGEIIRSVAALTDVTERNRAEKGLRESEEKFRLLAENAVDIIYRYRLSPNPGYEYISPAVTAATGYSPHEFYADPDLDIKIVHPDDLGTLRQMIDQDLPGRHALRWLHKDGSIAWMELTYVPIYGDDGTRVALEGVARDITDRKKAEATIEHMAYHDPLTDLPNRSLLKDHLELAIAQARRSGRKVAVMFLDVDRFKVINDTLGHSSGDKLLKRIGEQLTRVVRDGDTVARVGGDEFILLLPDLVDPDDARVVAERALQRIRRKRRLAGRDLVVTASLGISVYPSDGDDAETLLRHADTAMYKAKDQGRSRYEFYDASMGAAVSEQLRLESDLRRALAQDEFVLHYQPQIAIDSGEIVGIEALIRWQHPERGLLLPNEFIGVAQDSGLMSRLDERTLRAASAQCVAWQRAHSPSLRLSVNFETNALLDRGLPRMVESILRSSGLAPASLVVEITEKHAVQDLPSTQAALRQLKTMGVQIAVDDFGTGHSSLAYLSHFPIDVVKIDRAFVAGIGHTSEDSAIVVAIISMARGLGLKVIAEGVETEEQLAFLKALRCDEFQGYLFSKPVPPQEFEKLLSASGRRLRKRLPHGRSPLNA